MLGIGSTPTHKYPAQYTVYNNTHSLHLDGTDDCLDTGDKMQSIMRGSFSVGGWVRLDDGQVAATQGFFSNLGSTEDQIAVIVGANGVMFTSITSNADPSIFILGGRPGEHQFPDGQTDWAHIIVVYEDDMLVAGNMGARAYFNGIPQLPFAAFFLTSNANHAQYTNTSNNSTFGGKLEGDSVSLDMAGEMNSLFVYDIALNDLQAAAIYNSGNPVDLLTDLANDPHTDDLTHYYKNLNNHDDAKGTSNGSAVNNANFVTDTPY